MTKRYSIRMAAQLSGLTPLLIRTWENRYGVVKPTRSEGNQRQYTDEDIIRLRTLGQGVDKGFRIGQLSGMSNDEISALLKEKKQMQKKGSDYLSLCFHALEDLDSSLLENIFESAVIEKGLIQAIDEVLLAFLTRVGEGWNQGEWQIYQEHFASETVKSFLSAKFQSYQKNRDNPYAVVSTPSGQVHDIGAAAAAVAAAAAGFHVLYLGSDIPPEELINIVSKTQASVLILSIVFPGSPVQVKRDLDILHSKLPDSCSLFLGGSSAQFFSSSERTKLSRSIMELMNQLLLLREEIISR
ncbi:MAG: MerR family transcriptional regulator [Spirochaetales bacterium]|nr:MerR family transcriptional regulator [Spirochaetales bacterium]